MTANVKHWQIDIIESDHQIIAFMKNMTTQKHYSVQVQRTDYATRDEAIGALFSGPLPNVRDSFDTLTAD